MERINKIKQLLYFAYGSNMSLEQMVENRCETSTPLGVALLKGYAITQRRYADIDEEKGAEVWGVLYEISEHDLARLDVYEGYPEYYFRKELNVLFEDKEVLAIVYEMTKKRKALNENKRYSEDYRTLCHEAVEFWRLPKNAYSKDSD